MRLPNRNVSIFTLSAFDLLAMTTGVFVLMLVILMPYYRMTFAAHAEIEAVRAAVAATEVQIEPLDQRATEVGGEALALEAEAARLVARAVELETKPAPTPAPQEDSGQKDEQRVIEAIDLVFVVDTTASMTPAIRQLAASMGAIVRILERMVPSVRIGVAAYKDRDTGLAPVVALPLTPTDPHLRRIMAFVEGMDASPVGSRTLEEDLHLGLETAMRMRLRPDARQALVVIGDAAAHDYVQSETLFRTRNFVRGHDLRTVSTLYVSTPSSRRSGERGRPFFRTLAEAGGGSFDDHTGSMIESVLLAVLVDDPKAPKAPQGPLTRR